MTISRELSADVLSWAENNLTNVAVRTMRVDGRDDVEWAFVAELHSDQGAWTAYGSCEKTAIIRTLRTALCDFNNIPIEWPGMFGRRITTNEIHNVT